MTFLDFKGNYKQVKELNTYLKNDFCSILISGDHSSGKSSIYEFLLHENKFDILLVNSELFSENTLSQFIQCKTITSFFETNVKRKMIFFDDIDTINMNKNNIQLLCQFKKNCFFIFTVWSSEKRKIVTSLKKVIDHCIHLSNISFKDCVQIIFSKVKCKYNEDDIDFDKLVSLIKSQSCNINNIMMLMDDCINTNTVLSDELKDDYENNIYTLTKQLYNERLSDRDVKGVFSRDHGILFALVHENILDIPLEIDTYLTIYEAIAYCDLLDKHNYINCKWGLNADCLNYYRFKMLNNHIYDKNFKISNVKFTQQFTKLSTQASIKKKVLNINDLYFNNILDYLQCLSEKTQNSWMDKNEKELIARFKKDF